MITSPKVTLLQRNVIDKAKGIYIEGYKTHLYLALLCMLCSTNTGLCPFYGQNKDYEMWICCFSALLFYRYQTNPDNNIFFIIINIV